MLRHLPQPLHPGVLHLDVGVEALGHCLGDEGLALLAQQFDEAGFLANEGVDAGGFAVEMTKNPLNLLRRWLPDLPDPAYGDDGLDALACAWSASRIARGEALTLPHGEVPRDEAGRPMRICA